MHKGAIPWFRHTCPVAVPWGQGVGKRKSEVRKPKSEVRSPLERTLAGTVARHVKAAGWRCVPGKGADGRVLEKWPGDSEGIGLPRALPPENPRKAPGTAAGQWGGGLSWGVV